MTVLIKGMDMPKGCNNCLLCTTNSFDGANWLFKCDINGKETPMLNKRPEWCPLVEVPTPHGRLIDLDKVLYLIAVEYGYEGIEDDMYTIPSVIDAEETYEEKK